MVVLTLDGDGNDDGDNDDGDGDDGDVDGDDGDGISTGTGAAGGSHVGRRRILKRHSDGDRDAVKTGGDLCDDHLDHLQLPLQGPYETRSHSAENEIGQRSSPCTLTLQIQALKNCLQTPLISK